MKKLRILSYEYIKIRIEFKSVRNFGIKGVVLYYRIRVFRFVFPRVTFSDFPSEKNYFNILYRKNFNKRIVGKVVSKIFYITI